MKKKISSILGVALTLVLLVSLFGFAVPVSAADLRWSTQATPAGIGITWQLAAGTDASFITVAPDGNTIFAVDTQAATNVVYKSTNGGVSWRPSVVNPWGAGVPITGLALSPSYATDSTVIATAANQVYISQTGGTAFAVLGGGLPAGETIASLAISPIYSGGTGEIMVGTTAVGAATYGDVYIWGRFGVLNWAAQGLAEDVTSVAFSPNYPVDATILAVGSDATPQTRLHTKVSAFAWDVTIALTPLVINAAGGTGDAAPIVASSMAMGSNFNGSVPVTHRVYVATISGVADDIYAINAAGAVVMNATAAADDVFVSLAYSGDSTTGTLIAGQMGTNQVYRCANPTAVIGWLFLPATTPPTGAAIANVALAPDFATSSKIFAGTTGVQSALSISDDGGVNFYQVGLIDTAIAAVTDLQASPAFAADQTMFMITVTTLPAVPGDAVVDSIWKTSNGGTTWMRVATFATANDHGIVRFSPAFATDQTVYFAETGAGGVNLLLSNNAGATWLPRISPVAINDVLLEDANTIYVGNAVAPTVNKSVNGGWTWIPGAAVAPAATVHSLAQAGNGDILAGCNNGLVLRSTTAGATFAPLLGGIGAAQGNVAFVVFDANYADNSTVYAAGDALFNAGGTGVWRYVIGTDIAWNNIDAGPPFAGADAIVGLVGASDGTLYAATSEPSAVAAGGVRRSLAPTAFFIAGGVSPIFETVANADGLLPGYKLGYPLVLAEGTNQLWAPQTTPAPAPRVVTYTDTMTGASTLSLDVQTPTTASFSWTGMTGATNYTITVNTRSDFRGVATAPTGYVPPFTTATFTGLAPGRTYFARVQVATPLLSRWSNAVEFQTQMAAPGAVLAIAPAPGAQNVVLSPSFSWGFVAGAASYEVEVADNASYTGAIKGTSPVNAWQMTDTLEYLTTYYWRVIAISATGAPESTAIVGIFTTMAEPAPPVIVEPTPPAPPAPELVIEQVAPTYLWVIIGIGAILVIAVIVLIVRTRRA